MTGNDQWYHPCMQMALMPVPIVYLHHATDVVHEVNEGTNDGASYNVNEGANDGSTEYELQSPSISTVGDELWEILDQLYYNYAWRKVENGFF